MQLKKIEHSRSEKVKKLKQKIVKAVAKSAICKN